MLVNSFIRNLDKISELENTVLCSKAVGRMEACNSKFREASNINIPTEERNASNTAGGIKMRKTVSSRRGVDEPSTLYSDEDSEASLMVTTEISEFWTIL